MWICDFGNCYTWVEAGMTIGCREGSSGTGLTWFWAEWQEQGAGCDQMYHEHYNANWTVNLGTQYADKISYNGGYKWAIYKDGVWLANSAPCHQNTTDLMEAGGEISNSGSQVTATSTNLKKRGADGVTWTNNWGGSHRYATGPFDNPSTKWLIVDQAIQYVAN
jgi:hypothetical protein